MGPGIGKRALRGHPFVLARAELDGVAISEPVVRRMRRTIDPNDDPRGLRARH